MVKNTGIFTLVYDVIREDRVDPYTAEILQQHLDWFKKNLKIPTKFSRNKNDYHKNTHGVSWLKAEEQEMISKCYEMKNALENAGFAIEVIKKEYPGKIVYEDKYQVVAV